MGFQISNFGMSELGISDFRILYSDFEFWNFRIGISYFRGCQILGFHIWDFIFWHFRCLDFEISDFGISDFVISDFVISDFGISDLGTWDFRFGDLLEISDWNFRFWDFVFQIDFGISDKILGFQHVGF